MLHFCSKTNIETDGTVELAALAVINKHDGLG